MARQRKANNAVAVVIVVVEAVVVVAAQAVVVMAAMDRISATAVWSITL